MRVLEEGERLRAVQFYLSLPSWAKYDAAREIAGRLNADQFVEILTDCGNIYDSAKHKSMVIAAILPFLPADLLSSARKIVFANPNKFERKQSVIAFVRRVCEVGSPLEEFNRYCDAVSAQNRLEGLYDFASIVPLLVSAGGVPAVSKATTAIEDAVRWWS